MSNVDVKKIYKSHLKFKYEPPKDDWLKYLAEGENTYKEELKNMVYVKCISNYQDIELKLAIKTEDDPYLVTKERAKYLIEKGLVEEV